MIWSNEVLPFENEWYKNIKNVLIKIGKEMADKLEALETDEEGVLKTVPKEEPFFNRDEAIKKFQRVSETMTKKIAQHFGERAFKEGKDNAPVR